MTKLRFTNSNGRQEYVDKCSMEQVKKIMRIRLNMIELKSNFKGKYKDTLCPACEAEAETTEHVLKCREYQKLTKHDLNPEIIEEGGGISKNVENMQWLLQASIEMEKIDQDLLSKGRVMHIFKANSPNKNPISR